MFHRSTIGVIKEDGGIDAIHLYFDADSARTYSTLNSDYLSQEKVEELINLGDLISLGRYIRSEIYVYRPSSDFCLAFHRDDGLEGMEAQSFGSVSSWLSSFYMCQVAYLFDGKTWQSFERVETERKTKIGLEVLGYWNDSMGYRVTGVLDFASRTKLRGIALRQADYLT
jgi:hypothetical protein